MLTTGHRVSKLPPHINSVINSSSDLVTDTSATNLSKYPTSRAQGEFLLNRKKLKNAKKYKYYKLKKAHSSHNITGEAPLKG